jgi:hypothetical protein
VRVTTSPDKLDKECVQVQGRFYFDSYIFWQLGFS